MQLLTAADARRYNSKGGKMTVNENADKVQCPKCKGMMVPNVVKEGCGGNRTE